VRNVPNNCFISACLGKEEIDNEPKGKKRRGRRSTNLIRKRKGGREVY